MLPQSFVRMRNQPLYCIAQIRGSLLSTNGESQNILARPSQLAKEMERMPHCSMGPNGGRRSTVGEGEAQQSPQRRVAVRLHA